VKVRITKENDGLAVGTEMEGPQTHLLCELGIAEPIDDEARQKFAEFTARKDRLRRQMAEHARRVNAQQEQEQKQAEKARLAEFEAYLKGD